VENKKTDTEKKVLTIEEIKEILNSLLSLKNEISKRTYLIACSYFALGDHKNAENYFKTIINDCYYGELSRKMIGKIYEINNNYSEAEKYYEEKSPEIAYIYVQTNRYDEALRYVKRFNYYYTYPDEVKKAYVYEKIGDYLTKNKMKIYAIDYYNKSKETVELIIRDTKPDNESKLKLENDINRLNEKVIR
jgi:tetratricopeptide (TPR) repeat protein